MTVELAVGLAGLFLAACAFVVFFVDKVTKKETEIHLIKDHMGRILRKVDELQARETELLNRANDLAQAHHSRPDLAAFVSKQWEFVEKTFHNRFEKHRICRRIVTNHLCGPQ